LDVTCFAPTLELMIGSYFVEVITLSQVVNPMNIIYAKNKIKKAKQEAPKFKTKQQNRSTLIENGLNRST
jgi:hypothetical protein